MTDAGESGIRVLVIDDDPDLRFLVRQVLDRHPGFTVVGEAGNGDEGAAQTAALAPEVVLLDLEMPGVDGLQALPAIRAAAPDAKIVVLSHHPRQEMERIAIEGGALGYLEKGVRAGDLVERLLAITGALDVAQTAVREVRARVSEGDTGPRQARQFVDQALRRWHRGLDLDAVQLLVSELVTNALQHGGGHAEVVVTLRRGVVHVDVIDASPGRPQRREASAADERGRGLTIVEAMASAWGVEELPHGKSVWFELRRIDPVADETPVE